MYSSWCLRNCNVRWRTWSVFDLILSIEYPSAFPDSSFSARRSFVRRLARWRNEIENYETKQGLAIERENFSASERKALRWHSAWRRDRRLINNNEKKREKSFLETYSGLYRCHIYIFVRSQRALIVYRPRRAPPDETLAEHPFPLNRKHEEG